jgi:hypothetical protein
VEPSSTTITSKFEKLWDNTESRLLLMNLSLLKRGMTTEKTGFDLVVFTEA